MIRTFSLIIVTLGMFALTACETTQDWGTKQTVGTLGGAAAGGLLGSQIGKGSGRAWGAGVGVLLGALVGGEIGKSLDSADKAALVQAQDRAYAAPIGENIRWNNAQSGNHGTIVPVRDGTTPGGDYCREFQQTITVGGQMQKGYGTACRAPDGQWKIVS